MKLLSLLAVTLVVSSSAFADSHFCAGRVKEPAIKLFALHYGIDEATAALSISDEVAVKKSLTSPDGKRRYSVLETIASVGKSAEYRIRMIFAVLGKADPRTDCILMGQEILDLSSL